MAMCTCMYNLVSFARMDTYDSDTELELKTKYWQTKQRYTYICSTVRLLLLSKYVLPKTLPNQGFPDA